ncbi:hypothetical protein F4553_002862 [Allocatelliglobosispora scoriae]|uniref:DUF3043 domain-containing protein n=1 Tax=Allocatelliglobosispora scoriae TaxID=643052 RepID=A0A841BRE1_9ACTN|nr:DUF3043 domain-containing protein [Allocatelliglobosispora scoriae]MBB5869483.1 hypothetical protein [Allocatelliglobosispora scoriae]
MSTLFRRKPAEPQVIEEVTPAEGDLVSATRRATPSKKELGKVTPKRSDGRRKAEPPPANRREAYKRMREKQKLDRAEAMEGMRSGDERYLLARDKGPEKALVRDLIDSRRNVGTWFFGSAFLVLLGTSMQSPAIALYAQLLWFVIALAAAVDTVLICRKLGKLVRERFPKSEVKSRSLYFYAFMRSITFRRLRMPKPRVKLGESF